MTLESSCEVVRHGLDKYKEDSKEFDTFALLKLTSTLRTGKDII